MNDIEIKLLLQELEFQRIRIECRMYRVVFGSDDFSKEIERYHEEMDKCKYQIDILKKIIKD